jgi:hypothetical protein
MVLAIDVLAVVFFALGSVLAFKPGLFRAFRGGGDADHEGGVSQDVASALRIGGVMVMAFSATICVFANLIAYYSAAGAAG